MKPEYGIIVVCGILVAGIFALITNDPDTNLMISSLEKLNQQALEAKEAQDQNKLDSIKPLMKIQLKKITSSELEIPIESIYLEEDWNYPFRDSSNVKPHLEEHKSIPICNILPNLSLHLKSIQNTELFSMFGKKYQNYSIELDIADERYYNSTTHYGFTAKSGDNLASTFFHVNSCTGETSTYYYLMCRNTALDTWINSNYRNEVVDSLQDDEFCMIVLEPWRQQLSHYAQQISREIDNLLEQITMDGKSADEMNTIHNELQRMDSLNDMVRFAMMGEDGDDKLHQEMKEYEKRFGSVPDDLLELLK